MSKLSSGLNLQDSQNFSNENSKKIFSFFQKTSFFEFKVCSFTFNIYFDKSSTIPYSTVLIISDKMGPQTVWIKHSTKILSSYRLVGMFMGRGSGVVSKVYFRQIQNWSQANWAPYSWVWTVGPKTIASKSTSKFPKVPKSTKKQLKVPKSD